jgi:hypothetical protein
MPTLRYELHGWKPAPRGRTAPRPVFGKGTKVCPRCKVRKPLTREHWSYIEAKGLAYPYCKPCAAAKVAAYRKANPMRTALQQQAAEARRKLVDPGRRRWRMANRERHLANRRQWRAHNRERLREQNRAQYWRHRAKKLQQSRKWRATHPGYQAAKAREWERRHPLETTAQRAAAMARRRLRESQGGKRPSRDEILGLYAIQNGRCAYCDKALGAKFHLDHKVPVSRGGTNVLTNLCCACASCNLRKCDQTAEEFMARRRMR